MWCKTPYFHIATLNLDSAATCCGTGTVPAIRLVVIQQRDPLQRPRRLPKKAEKVQNYTRSKCEYSGWEKARHLATAGVNYPWGRGEGRGGSWRWRRRGGGEETPGARIGPAGQGG